MRSKNIIFDNHLDARFGHLRLDEIDKRINEDVDMIAKTITVNHQTCNAATTTPKGRTRRTRTRPTHAEMINHLASLQ